MATEQTPLIAIYGGPRGWDKYAHGSIIFGLALFIALIGSVLVRIPFNVFTFHPIFMTLFIVLLTEGIALLQPTSTSEEKRKGLYYHALIQSTSYLSAIIGFSFIFYNKVISNKSHFESLHGKLGLFVFVYLFIQLLFGITITLTPTLYGSIDKAKSLWKYHRILGYALLLLVWFTSQLGVRADYMYNNLYDIKLIYLHWLSLTFVVAGLVYRTRTRKWGVKFNQ
ncbi:uncharacterized protein RHIMIDRAFT_197516 [Rhizopus microsporus ATCC 52813]|uniref:Cytochrome b561 domain-containing protein n=1 Tax=Rhizopus microsporus ATCC 52813 TaxID=1340429 RepID=A0A2G4T5K9_RHIZD|nr:uncharacterized protein RHIMIDRAFT_197516 [Rhizopus microsporus ATCC 52813]PHZ16289.1 hypothetical protein RHIMIDRAFT_197516 [Rhizopus microsporus ATCC 52813]